VPTSVNQAEANEFCHQHQIDPGDTPDLVRTVEKLKLVDKGQGLT